MAEQASGAYGQVLGIVSHVLRRQPVERAASSAWASCPTSRRRSSSSSSARSVPVARAAAEGRRSGRKKINEYTRYVTVPICVIQAYIWIRGLMRPRSRRVGGSWPRGTPTGSTSLVRVRGRPDHDRRHHLPDVARRADRRVRHRQRHQLIIMAGILARIPGHAEPAVRDTRPTGDSSRSRSSPSGRAPATSASRSCSLLVVLFVAVVVGGDRDHREPAADPDPVGQARPRPAGLRRDPAVPAAEGEPGRRHADHLRQQLLDLPVVRLQPDRTHQAGGLGRATSAASFADAAPG